MTPSCEGDPFKGLYTEFALSLPLCILFQLILFGNTIFYHCKRTVKKDTTKSTDNRIHLLLNLTYIIIQLLTIDFIVTELFRFVIDPKTSLSNNNTKLCNMFSYYPQLIIIIYYACYTLHILFRIEISFKGYLSLHQYTSISLLSIAIIPLFTPFFIIFEPNTCIQKWIPFDINNTLSFCAYQSNIFIIISICYAILINITLAVIFMVKIKQLFFPIDNKNKIENNTLKVLLIKYSILSFIGCISILLTVILYFIFYSTINIGTFLLYFDLCLHCLILTLMYNYNANYYTKCCNYCIIKLNHKIESKQHKISTPLQMNSPIDSPTPNTPKITATNGVKSHKNIENKSPEIVYENNENKSIQMIDITVENIDKKNEKSNDSNNTDENEDIITEMKPSLPKNLKLHLSANSIETQLKNMTITPPSVVMQNINAYDFDNGDAYNRDKRDSMFATFDQAQVIKALVPIQKGIKRYIGTNEKWKPIQYEHKVDNSNILAPKKSATNILDGSAEKKKNVKVKSVKMNGNKSGKAKKLKKKSVKKRVES